MKTLILYATKHGATKEIAQELAQALEGATLWDLKRQPLPSLNDYDCVILGSSVYAGMLRKEAKAFAQENEKELRGKTLGLFLSAFTPGEPEKYLQSNYPKTLVDSAKAKATLGGIFDPAQSGFFDQLVMKMILKSSQYKSTLSSEAIRAFAEELKG